MPAMNVRFEYLYRDAGNFKRWGEVVFSNANNVDADSLTAIAEEALRMDHLYFVASEVDVPDLHFADYIEVLDHGWHEIHAFHFTDDAPNDAQTRDFEMFAESLLRASQGLHRV